jgi:outer membrane protein OmpA-like peptidoglycan-associated protein
MKTSITFIAIMTISLFAFSCAKEQVKQPEKVGVDTAFISTSNDQLSRYPVSGFAYKSSKIPTQEWDKWAKVAEPVVRRILDKVPDGYVMEIRGHTDSSGPEMAEDSKPGNEAISTNRAKAVYDALIRAGVSKSKLTYRGVASTEMIPGVNPRSGAQRRVTFVIVPK